MKMMIGITKKEERIVKVAKIKERTTKEKVPVIRTTIKKVKRTLHTIITIIKTRATSPISATSTNKRKKLKTEKCCRS